MSRAVIGSRAELIAALRAQLRKAGAPGMCHGGGCRCAAAALEERIRAVREELFLDALFLVAQFPGGQVAEADKCCYAHDVRLCAGLCRATWAEEAFWSGLVRVAHPGPRKVTRLIVAAHRGDAARVAWLLARGAPREVMDADGMTALFHATMQGCTDAACALIAAGANVDASVNGYTVTYYAACNGHTDILRALLAAGANFETTRTNARTPLYDAAENGRTDAVRMLLAAGANFNATIELFSRKTALHAAAAGGHADAARALLAAGADANAVSTKGETPLHVAVLEDHFDAIRALLAAGANVNAAAADGSTPLLIAAKQGFLGTVRVLIAAGANLETAAPNGRRALHLASAMGHLDVMRALVRAGADKSAPANCKDGDYEFGFFGDGTSDLFDDAMDLLGFDLKDYE
jgi:ankyrin repeat protein